MFFLTEPEVSVESKSAGVCFLSVYKNSACSALLEPAKRVVDEDGSDALSLEGRVDGETL